MLLKAGSYVIPLIIRILTQSNCTENTLQQPNFKTSSTHQFPPPEIPKRMGNQSTSLKDWSSSVTCAEPQNPNTVEQILFISGSKMRSNPRTLRPSTHQSKSQTFQLRNWHRINQTLKRPSPINPNWRSSRGWAIELCHQLLKASQDLNPGFKWPIYPKPIDSNPQTLPLLVQSPITTWDPISKLEVSIKSRHGHFERNTSNLRMCGRNRNPPYSASNEWQGEAWPAIHCKGFQLEGFNPPQPQMTPATVFNRVSDFHRISNQPLREFRGCFRVPTYLHLCLH